MVEHFDEVSAVNGLTACRATEARSGVPEGRAHRRHEEGNLRDSSFRPA